MTDPSTKEPDSEARARRELGIEVDSYEYGFHDEHRPSFKSRRGLDRSVVEEISAIKGEPSWMRKFRLRALEIFRSKPQITWGDTGKIRQIRFDDIHYYVRPTDRQGRTWDEVPEEIRNTFDRLGIPEAERKFLAGVGAQYDSEVVYHNIQEELEKKGVIFLDMDSGLRKHPDLVREYFGTVVPPGDNKYAALNSAVWSGGSFVYVPEGVKVEVPLQAYFRINTQNMGQFERTLIIAEPGSFVHYIEGCTAPVYSSDSLHSAVVEIIARPGARVRYSTVQNWSKNVFNLVTKRAAAWEDATVEWVDGNLGSKLTMKYPCVYLMGKGAKADLLSIALAGRGQHQDAGGKAIHVAPYTTSIINSKSISMLGGKTTYRGLIKVHEGAVGCKSQTTCAALMFDDLSSSDTIPYIDIDEKQVDLGHEASVSRVSEEQLFYLMSRGLSETQAVTMIVSGFIDPIVKALPLEYSVELNRLIELEMEGRAGVIDQEGWLDDWR